MTPLLDWFLVLLHAVVGSITAVHALLYKREPSAALGWIAACLLIPLAGPIAYCFFGVNRVQTRAKRLSQDAPGYPRIEPGRPRSEAVEKSAPVDSRFTGLARISDALGRFPLVAGNDLEVLHGGDQAYPAMVAAMDDARHHILLSSYIFETNESGIGFIDAAERAIRRGIDVRILIDGFGEWYSLPRASRLLRERGVPVARFLPPTLLPPTLHVNLRNHRKILVVDGDVAFTGGMNIGDRHVSAGAQGRARVIDVHFRLRGPVVRQIQRVFADDWTFVTGGGSDLYVPAPATRGTATCRAVTSGPDEALGALAMILVDAISAARRRVSLMTPYFLPSREIIVALQAAALRGIEVSVVLPSKNNLPFVHWATRNMLPSLLEHGVGVYYQPPPFVHSKLFMIDDGYAQIGSANIDPRSLRLNFELAVEVFDEAFSGALAAHFNEVRARSRRLTMDDLEKRAPLAKFRDAVAWLFSPYF